MGTTNSPPHSRMKAQLLHDLILQIPRKDDHVIRFRLPDPIRVIDRDMTTRQEPPLLVRTAIHGEFDQVFADPAVVEQCSALAGCTVAGNFLALSRRQTSRNSTNANLVSLTC